MTMTTATQISSTPKWQVWAVYVVMALLTFMFLMAGGTKLIADEMHVTNFARWGYPSWFMYVTGLIEVSSIILMWIPKTRFYGALGLMFVMVGAIGTHLINSEFVMAPIPVGLILLAGVVAWFNRPS